MSRLSAPFCFVLGTLLLVIGGTSVAATKSEQEAANALVQDALHRSVYGLCEERESLLQQALEIDPDNATARWQLGYVQRDGKWVLDTVVPADAEKDERLAAYDHRRAQTEMTIASQLGLAKWCKKRGLHDQARAHFAQVVRLAPNHVDARESLGFQRVGIDWVTSEALERARERQTTNQKNFATWQSKIAHLRNLTRHDSQHLRDSGTSQIIAIEDPTAIPALEAILCNDHETSALLALQAFSNMEGEDVTFALVRNAIYSDFILVRRAATEQLKRYNRDYFVPALVGEMYTPVTSEASVLRGRGGTMLVRHAFIREGQSQKELMVLDTEYRRSARAGGNRADSLQRAIQDIVITNQTREMGVEQQNQMTRLLNQRIASVLNEVTGETLVADPQLWWKWWNQDNEVFVAGEKPVATIYDYTQETVVDRTGETGGTTGSQMTMDCLAPGTPVWTLRGQRPIEEIEPGDLVLSQNPESSELAYKAVLQTTLRPEGQLIRIYAGSDAFETSGGHLFWVTGEGWTKSRDLQPGVELQTSRGPLTVERVEAGTKDVTHNLVVDGFSTYFVGAERILSHDNTVRRATDKLVPGLVK